MRTNPPASSLELETAMARPRKRFGSAFTHPTNQRFIAIPNATAARKNPATTTAPGRPRPGGRKATAAAAEQAEETSSGLESGTQRVTTPPTSRPATWAVENIAQPAAPP